jgi:dihydrofolate synthase/folylpolyglutamate synthase
MSQNPESEPEEFLELFNKRSTVIKPGLERVRAALETLGSPAKDIPKITVAGTNGKGSTSGYIYRMLASLGLKVGFFSSPHLMAFRERIALSHQEVTDSDLLKALSDIRSRLPAPLWEELTFFEINTILAFVVFQGAATDINVLEVGLGGRLDCVNVYDPDIAVITSIGLDHAEFLGSDLRGIASEKAGIMRSSRPVFWGNGARDGAEVEEVIRRRAGEAGAIFREPDATVAQMALPDLLAGKPEFLRRNFALAASVVMEWSRSRGLALSLPGLLSRFDDKNLPWPVTLTGRFDFVRVSKDGVSRSALIDVCHNPHGARALSEALRGAPLRTGTRPLNCLISVLADKDAAGIWSELKDNIKDQIAFQISSPRTWGPDHTGFAGELAKSFDSAWHRAVFEKDWDPSEPILIFGSVAAVGEVLRTWQRTGWSVERVKFNECAASE